MSITDELREWGSRWEDAVAREVSEIADRIDEQHRKALEKVAAMVDEPDEIVQCGDCRWRRGVVCGYFDKITWVMDFCSHGTRRTE